MRQQNSDFQEWQAEVESQLGFLCNRELAHFPDVDLEAIWRSGKNPEEAAGMLFVASLPGTGVDLPRRNDAPAARTPSELGATRYVDGTAEFWDGEQWLSEREAVDTLGQLAREERMGAGGTADRESTPSSGAYGAWETRGCWT